MENVARAVMGGIIPPTPLVAIVAAVLDNRTRTAASNTTRCRDARPRRHRSRTTNRRRRRRPPRSSRLDHRWSSLPRRGGATGEGSSASEEGRGAIRAVPEKKQNRRRRMSPPRPDCPSGTRPRQSIHRVKRQQNLEVGNLEIVPVPALMSITIVTPLPPLPALPASSPPAHPPPLWVVPTAGVGRPTHDRDPTATVWRRRRNVSPRRPCPRRGAVPPRVRRDDRRGP